MACAVASKVIEIVSNPIFLDEVKKKENLIMKGLEIISNKFNAFSAIRSSGLWIGCDLEHPYEINDLLNKCYENGLIAVSAGTSTLRFAPALNIKEDEISEGLEKLEQALTK
jgi:acetylornithine/N-succinyldiaminopimelate aminotransferase